MYKHVLLTSAGALVSCLLAYTDRVTISFRVEFTLIQSGFRVGVRVMLTQLDFKIRVMVGLILLGLGLDVDTEELRAQGNASILTPERFGHRGLFLPFSLTFPSPSRFPSPLSPSFP